MFATPKRKREAWEQDCSVHAGLMKAEYLQNRKDVSDNSVFVRRWLLLSNVGGKWEYCV